MQLALFRIYIRICEGAIGDLEDIPEMRISEVRRELAPLVNMTEDNLRVRTDALYKQSQLHAILPGRRAVGSDREGLLATAGATALVTLTAMLGKTRETIGPEVVRLWEATCATGNPLEKCETAGALLITLLKDSRVRRRLKYFEVDHDIPHLAFEFKRGLRLVYSPYAPGEWQRRMDDAEARGDLAHISRLPTATLDKVARLIEEGTHNEAPHKKSRHSRS